MPNTNDYPMPLNETPAMKISAYATDFYHLKFSDLVLVLNYFSFSHPNPNPNPT